ncbi:hypothetical protein M569_00265 [Genlisea aurea]|uniref:Uncharacterized protein n=1 Tax=Genlisea aurea TaxID=192259 RepID=S8D444_9LAMI|nr:hypothetical protein M569_00265 [Genlisea aurea]
MQHGHAPLSLEVKTAYMFSRHCLLDREPYTSPGAGSTRAAELTTYPSSSQKEKPRLDLQLKPQDRLAEKYTRIGWPEHSYTPTGCAYN